MNFRKNRRPDEPEINLVPFIDILLVIIIFLVITTTYARFTELQISLPVADANRPDERPAQIQVAVAADGRYAINNQRINYQDPASLAAELLAAAKNNAEAIIVINADASASHQSVVNVLEAARIAGLVRITFATQSNAK
ncbi:MAG: ExbD/TolR family protein [Burkholderiales bacterium]|jgi:biopolymer transport protein ExbD|nr:biopolymer transporter ExbD [Burkholderiales bacterium]MCA3154393.1 biopolymer transporter ExbD [Burkholderiales bacterium]MCA3157385.1 biopolymer transporter ExbD [Burkholderiales bacterium]MCA3160142.1 biopolymer transporter ExbD [Burkholderiales bacterium]MCA3162300.1 biopolymer transporter ExbD [Burkholderiales bacterium]